jgi:D-sedoheptulose 7-phosphate isomerase
MPEAPPSSEPRSVPETVDSLRATFTEAASTITAFLADESNLIALERFVALTCATFRRGGRVFACGNGGSLCEAMHFAEELTGRFRGDRPPLPALALNDPGAITCIANDFGFEQVFARQLEALGSAGDLLLLLSTSGESRNLVEAASVARDLDVSTVALLGRDGGKLAPMVDVPIVVPEATTSDRIQEVHLQILHASIEEIERRLFGATVAKPER